jgi:hypothetical protein
MRIHALASLPLLLLAAACSMPQDNPTQVKDLRVLALSLESPELMAPSCDTKDPRNAFVYATPLTLRALVADPKGEGRDITWELLACAAVADRTCEDEENRLVVASGTLKPGELELTQAFGTLTLPQKLDAAGNPVPLLTEVLAKDTYKGLGGLRMPLVLHVKAGDEEIFAQKLMVFSCRFFPEQQQNVTPVLPGLRLGGEPWGEGTVRELSGPGPFEVEPEPYAELEEPYLVPSFDLKPVQLQESWKFAWYVTGGRMSLEESGGTDVDGTSVRPGVLWEPTSKPPSGELTFYVVVRDGRGGSSWYVRRARYTP